MKWVILAGATSFAGTNLAEKLIENGYEVHILLNVVKLLVNLGNLYLILQKP